MRGKCYLDESVGLFLAYAQGSSIHKLPFQGNKQVVTNRVIHDTRIVHIPGIHI